MVVAYDGGPFRGFAVNDGVRTVMGELGVAAAIRRALARRVDRRRPHRRRGARVGPGRLRRPPGHHRPPRAGAAAQQALRAGDRRARGRGGSSNDFDARFSASWRHYRYDVWNAPTPNPLRAGRAWFVPQPLQLWAMQAACDPLLGEHDFASFCRRPKPARGTAVAVAGAAGAGGPLARRRR